MVHLCPVLKAIRATCVNETRTFVQQGIRTRTENHRKLWNIETSQIVIISKIKGIVSNNRGGTISNSNSVGIKINFPRCRKDRAYRQNAIIKDKKEPLYNRQTRFMTVHPFTPAVLKEILTQYHPGHTAEDLLALYSFTGGVAKYVQLLVDAGATTKSAMLDHIVKADSIFLGEGKAIIIEEFGKDYGVYFSILSAIARGKTSRSEIENVVGREIGGYLTKLENEYEVIAKKQPLFEKSSTKNIRYTIEDNFFTFWFWFRFIYKYSYMLEIENYESVKTIINRDYETFSGLMLERYFRRVLIERQAYTRIGGWWDRKGENEIDIVAENELDGEATFFEVKRKADNIDMKVLENKAAAFLRATDEFKGYKISYKGLSMDDM